MTKYNRQSFPLDVGDTIKVDGNTYELVDLPTDGPEFQNLDAEHPIFGVVQMTYEEFEEVYDG